MLEQLSLYLSGGSQRFRGGQHVEFVQSMVRDREPLKVVPSAFRRRPEQASNYTERNQELFFNKSNCVAQGIDVMYSLFGWVPDLDAKDRSPRGAGVTVH